VTDTEPTEQVLTPDAATFRETLGHFVTGVTIITALDGDEPVGMAANSFTSVSLDPPLILFCAAHNSTTWPRIRSARQFTVNILDEHQEDLCRLFAQRGVDRFSQVGWRPGAGGAPVLDDVHAYIDCDIWAEYEGGDHMIVVGRVLELGVSADAGPLLFYRGTYGRLLGS
jgi:3-hydroxy-9,10-secoandrosta-1,3,5(10)-triene-9,17-dione monooxygenase reductase component